MFPPKEAINDKGYIEDYTVEDGDIWCDFEVGYDLDNRYYYLSFETLLGFKPGKCKEWIKKCLDTFTEYMVNHKYNTEKELDMCSVFTDGINVNTQFNTIEDTYAFMKFVVNGFNGDALLMSSESEE